MSEVLRKHWSIKSLDLFLKKPALITHLVIHHLLVVWPSGSLKRNKSKKSYFVSFFFFSISEKAWNFNSNNLCFWCLPYEHGHRSLGPCFWWMHVLGEVVLVLHLGHQSLEDIEVYGKIYENITVVSLNKSSNHKQDTGFKNSTYFRIWSPEVLDMIFYTSEMQTVWQCLVIHESLSGWAPVYIYGGESLNFNIWLLSNFSIHKSIF